MKRSCLILLVVMCGALVHSASGQDFAKERLDKSPRHHEWVDVKRGERTIRCFKVYPEVKDQALAVLVIHENKGLTDWVRGVADQLAEAGYIAIAPDLLSGMGEKGGGTDSLKSLDAATQGIYKLPQDQVTADLLAVADHVVKDPAASGKLAVAGFCWGGGQVLRFAAERSDLKAACVFYGMAPLGKEQIAKIASPVYGFYGGNDARINATIPDTTAQFKAAGKTYEPVVYEGAGHGFMRAGEDPKGDAANRKGAGDGWVRLKAILKKAAN